MFSNNLMATFLEVLSLVFSLENGYFLKMLAKNSIIKIADFGCAMSIGEMEMSKIDNTIRFKDPFDG